MTSKLCRFAFLFPLQTKKGVDIAADPGESVLQTCQALCVLEVITQGELLNSWDSERGRIRAERIAGGHIVECDARTGGNTGIESHRVSYVENLPCEFQALPFCDAP